LIRQALALTRDRCSAEDLVQDTLERGLQSRDKFRPGTNVGAWLGTILRNRFVDTYRQARRPVDLKDVGVLEEPTAELGPIDVFTFDDIMRALARLRPRSQEIFSWVYLQRRSYQEIAETAQIPLSTVGTRLFRVRGELRRALQKEFDRRMNGGSRREGAVAAALPRPSRPSVPYAMAMCGPRSSRAVVFAAAV
jgi:RNA polymerase sigma-70 factor (ECF subfamily)